MTRQTNADNIGDAIRNLGGTPKGGRPTTADLLDQLEGMLDGGGGSPSDITEGHLTEDDFDDIFGGGNAAGV